MASNRSLRSPHLGTGIGPPRQYRTERFSRRSLSRFDCRSIRSLLPKWISPEDRKTREEYQRDVDSGYLLPHDQHNRKIRELEDEAHAQASRYLQFKQVIILEEMRKAQVDMLSNVDEITKRLQGVEVRVIGALERLHTSLSRDLPPGKVGMVERHFRTTVQDIKDYVGMYGSVQSLPLAGSAAEVGY